MPTSSCIFLMSHRLRKEEEEKERERRRNEKVARRRQRRFEREEKRRFKREEEKRLEEERQMQIKIAMEERKILIAQRKLETIRLFSELFNRVKVCELFIFAFFYSCPLKPTYDQINSRRETSCQKYLSKLCIWYMYMITSHCI